MADQALIQSLRDILKQTPDNVAIRKHLAELLMQSGDYEAAATEYQQGLTFHADDATLKLGLVEAFYHQGKTSAALVVAEEVIQSPGQTPPKLLIWAARLYLQENEVDKGYKAYCQAVELDASLANPQLEDELKRNHQITRKEPADDERMRVPAGEQPDDEIDPWVEKPDIRFEDVGGMDDLKEEINLKIIEPLRHPDIYKAYGKAPGGGILLYGPPGCGKTYLARATAGEVNARFISIGIHDVLDMWIGQSEQNLHYVFELARANTPCVLFFDEVDALGASRTDMKRSAGRQLINQFLAELDGMSDSNDGILILAATNAPWHLDSAFRRPGRFDRILFVPPPDRPAREAILQIHLKDKPVESVDYAKIAKKTDHFSGADLKAVIDQAIELKLREAMKQGRPSPITSKDLLTAAKSQQSSTKEWFSTARNYALYSNESGLYDDILAYLKIKR